MLFAGALAGGAISGAAPGPPRPSAADGARELSRAGHRRHAGLPVRLARRLGHRPLGRAPAARAPRALAARDAREPRPRRALVRPPRARRGLPRAPHAASCAPSSRSRPGRSRARSARTPLLTLAGSAIWCFGFAAAGWALGSSYEQVHHAFRYVDVLAVAGAVAALAAAARPAPTARAGVTRAAARRRGPRGAGRRLRRRRAADRTRRPRISDPARPRRRRRPPRAPPPPARRSASACTSSARARCPRRCSCPGSPAWGRRSSPSAA